jgi:hypothetical protein
VIIPAHRGGDKPRTHRVLLDVLPHEGAGWPLPPLLQRVHAVELNDDVSVFRRNTNQRDGVVEAAMSIIDLADIGTHPLMPRRLYHLEKGPAHVLQQKGRPTPPLRLPMLKAPFQGRPVVASYMLLISPCSRPIARVCGRAFRGGDVFEMGRRRSISNILSRTSKSVR